MDGLFHGKPNQNSMDLGGPPLIFGNTHIGYPLILRILGFFSSSWIIGKCSGPNLSPNITGNDFFEHLTPRSGSHILQTEAEMEWFAEQVFRRGKSLVRRWVVGKKVSGSYIWLKFMINISWES